MARPHYDHWPVFLGRGDLAAGLTIPWDERYGRLLELAEACDVPDDCDLAPLDAPAPGRLLLRCARPRGAVTVDL